MRYNIVVYGLVQGIGYRPYVAELAEKLNITGTVKNAGGIVKIIAEGEKKVLDYFVSLLKSTCPQGGYIKEIQLEINDFSEEKTFTAFKIMESADEMTEQIFLPADLPTCPQCESELYDQSDRRYKYPFISCVACGPRYSIMNQLPYDRETITMNRFPMCKKCSYEYTAHGNRRRHAQTISCHDCGPQLCLITASNQAFYKEEAFHRAVCAIQEGKIAAVKDIGGFHFAVLPEKTEAIKRLRAFKHREQKPFAVMFRDIDTIKKYAYVSKKEQELLLSPPRPIVLLLKKEVHFFEGICDESLYLGAMLPCNPLQMLLLDACGTLVMTSGNFGGEPIIIRDDEMQALMQQGCPDIILTHERKIVTPLEDSILQVTTCSDGRDLISMLRRSRGYVPTPITMHVQVRQDTLAAGGDLKAGFALVKKSDVYMGGYFGDLEDYRAFQAWKNAKEHMSVLMKAVPRLVVGDKHPNYLSSKNADICFFHHHVHIASVIAEHHLSGSVLGLAFDGTGYGADDTIWGSEFLICTENQFERIAHLSPVKMISGDTAARNAVLALAAYVNEAYNSALVDDEIWHLKCFQQENVNLVKAALNNNIHTVQSTSMGRLFDAACALLDINYNNAYEGECACRLETAAQEELMKNAEALKTNAAENFGLHLKVIENQGKFVLDAVRFIVDLFYAKKSGLKKEEIALAFHMALSNACVEICQHYCAKLNINQVVLSGGTFYNKILLKNIYEQLAQKDIKVFTNEKVPCGDGGLALGQAYLASFIQ